MVKRSFDICISLLGLIMLVLPFLVIAVLIKAGSTGPVLYWSQRIGKDSTSFSMPKFRSMRIDTPEVATDKLLAPEQYLTKTGALLRKTSLDELPQLFSVLRGDMSLVGPRPALYNQHELIRLRKSQGIDKLRPGITGWAQINGRDEIDLAQKISLDLEYMRQANMVFDIKIILLTIVSVLSSKNVTH